MKYFSTLGSEITIEKFGGKAYWLNWLYANKINIPETYFLPAMLPEEINAIINQVDFRDELISIWDNINNENGVAIRSSAICEDGMQESKAGNFLTCLFVKNIDEIIEGIQKVISSTTNNIKMGVVIQKMIKPQISGIVFSSNPITASKKEIVVSAVSGQGEKLVSGNDEGTNFAIEVKDEKFIIPKININLSTSILLELAKLTKQLEKKLNLPIDIEWCYDKRIGLIILQCRPVTTIFINNQIGKITNDFMPKIPNKLINSDKITLRLLAENNKINMSDGYLVMCNCTSEDFPFASIDIARSINYRGYSVVLLYPTRISKKIIRSFIGDKHNVSNVTKCHRYGIRSLPDYENLYACLETYYKRVRTESWICSIIIQEIYDPLYTGIIKKSDSKYIIEFAKGHFVSKGVVPMSSYILDEQFNILFKNEIMQYRHIGIVEGCTLEYGCSDDDDSKVVSLPEKELKNIITTFQPILNQRNVTIEFGILHNNINYEPYLIDCVEENTVDNVNLMSVQNGVLSEGKIEGRLKILDLGNFNDSLNSHFYNEIDNTLSVSSEKIIFYAKLPSIKFLDILGKYKSSDIGFVFEKGSLLCHLSVLLREKGIPAIIGVSPFGLKEGEAYQIDTTANKKFIAI
jgi:hypothetical protein